MPLKVSLFCRQVCIALARSHCESELEWATAAGWLTLSARKEAQRVCFDAGTVCSASGTACTDPVGDFWAAVGPVLDRS